MNGYRVNMLVIGLCILVCANALRADMVLETRDVRLVIGANGVLKNLTSKATGAEYAWTEEPCPIAVVYRGGEPSADHRAILADTRNMAAFVDAEAPVYHGGEAFPATAATINGNRLTVHFGKSDVVAVYKVKATPTYMALELASIEGGPVDRIDLLHLRVKKLPHLGPWIDAAYDDRFGICLCAGNVKTNAGMNIHDAYVDMQAMAERQVALIGTTAVLFGFDWQPGADYLAPDSKFLDQMEIVERDFQMPSGAQRRRLPIQRESYLSCRPNPDNIDKHITYAKQMGLKIIEIQWGAFCTGPGHFDVRPRYPNGLADVKAMTDKIRNAGLHVGLHLHYNKAVRSDAYVTPVPDARLRARRTFTLTEPIDAKTDMLVVRENPQGSTLDNKRRILRIGKELVSYESYTTQPPFQFRGCQRGHLKTRAAAHAAGEAAALLDVDSWTVFIRYDQNTDIQEETARRIADIYEQTGPYDFVYFDGAEDVHDPYWYTVSKAQYDVYRLWKREPPACEAACNMHFGWHISTRGHAYDPVGSKQVKAFVHRFPGRTAPVAMRSFTRINFGWLRNVWNSPDIVEYVASRAAAWDCPISFMIADIDKIDRSRNPRLDDSFAAVKSWEEARCSGRLTAAHRAMLRTLDPSLYRYISCRLQEPGWGYAATEKGLTDKQRKQLENLDQEHHLLVNETGEYELVLIDEIAGVADGKVKAYRFRRSSSPDDTWGLVWATAEAVELNVPVGSERLTAMRPLGTQLPIRIEGPNAVVPVGGRTYLKFAQMTADEVIDLLRKATAK